MRTLPATMIRALALLAPLFSKRIKSRIDTVGLFVWHAEKGRNCIHQNSKIGSRTHFEAPLLNKPTVSRIFCNFLQDGYSLIAP